MFADNDVVYARFLDVGSSSSGVLHLHRLQCVQFIVITQPPVGELSVVTSVSVCLSVRTRILY